MKNSEWGAVAYLTHSIYGRNKTAITVNNSSSYYTGYALNKNNGSSYPYDSPESQEASTTGNYTGIYDICGNSMEYVAAYITNGNASLTTYGSSFVSTVANTNPQIVSTAYATAYPYNASESELNNKTNFKNNYTGIRYGDAIIETGTMASTQSSWFGQFSHFPYGSSPFFLRGGNNTNGGSGGSFCFVYQSGANSISTGYRIVLIP